ncbi:DeoR/GlpR family DNA-binding transcription regulator [Amycolatopsis sp.]|uniref:DeoR/GlpR family DNA-binding transcription regulator n=1 Tax=Amycolatopsis sp. TaxID=37632 RepID=UPI002E0B7F52|nr:DeoR/GlpR family DNA-binding transcription regulator [Amycolatopsis sp.]
MAKTRPSDAAVEQRRQDVLEFVIEQREVRIDDLPERFGVSLMTIHRDLDDLAERRLLVKLRGKVEAYPALTVETAARFRDGLNQPEKEALAIAAVAHVEPGQTVFVDDSTTLFPLVHRLAEVSQLVVVTNSLRIAQMLGPADGVEVVLLGGRYSNEFDSCMGPHVLAALDRIRADIGFISVTAVAAGRLYHPVQDYAELKMAALRASNRNVLVVDNSKFGKTATYPHGNVGDYDLMITDDAAPTPEIEAAANFGTAVELVTVDHSVQEGKALAHEYES